jgi:type I restriction enzyme S subunit
MTVSRTQLGQVAWIDSNLVNPTLEQYRDLPHVSAEHITSVTGELKGVGTAFGDGMTSSKYLFEPGDILYSKLRPYLRKVTIAPYVGLCSADMYPLKTDVNIMLPDFLRILLVSNKFTEYANEASARTRMPKLNREQLFQYEFDLPSLAEQVSAARAVTSQIGELEAGRKAASKQHSEILPLRSAMFRDAFQQVIPITIPPSFPAAPTGWVWKKLSSVATLESGHTPSRLQPEWWGGDISWLSLTEIRALDGTWVEQTQIRTNPAGIANSSARILPRGTVCLSRTASVGFVAIMAEPMATSQDFANWVCGDDLDPEFLMFALIASRKAIRDMATGATHKTIYMPALGSFHICAPDIDEQRRIAKRLKGQLAEVAALQAALSQRVKDIAALPKRILAQAFEI